MLWTFMQNKIIIFGDSFADSADRKYENKNVTTWYESLESDYEIINNALSGTGPHYSFKDYYNFISDNEIRKEDYITIFLLSGEDRIHFPNMAPGEMNDINWDFDKKKSWWIEDPKLKKVKVYYDLFKSEIDFLFLTMHDELKWFNLKNVGFLYMNSLLLNMKTIVFCTNGIKVLSRMSSFLDITKLNSPNFYLYPTELGHIAHEEFTDLDTVGGYDFADHRRNHFSQKNHTILYENIKKFIKNDYKTIPFAKNIDYSYNFGKKRDTKKDKFIYE